MRLSYSIQTLSAATALLLTCAEIHASPAGDLITKGDGFDLKLQPAEALKCYLPAEKMEPENVHLLVHIARQYRHLMVDAGTGGEKLRLVGIALDYSKRAAALAPDEPQAQLAVALSYGKMLLLQSSKKEKVATSRNLKAAADKTIQLDPSNDTAWHILGRWYKNMADLNGVARTLAQLLYGKLPPATNEDAVRCFEKAIALNPSRLMNYVELGRTYAQMGRTSDARRYISKGLAMPSVELDDPETKARGREALAELQ